MRPHLRKEEPASRLPGPTFSAGDAAPRPDIPHPLLTGAQGKDPRRLACGGEPVETGEKLQVTGREELRRYIRQELRELQPKEAADG